LPFPLAAFPATKKVTGPALVAGGVQSNWNVAPFLVPLRVPAEVCWMNEGPDAQGLGALSSQITCVKPSTGVKSPAWPFVKSLFNRAVNSKPHRCCAESATWTATRCFTPGMYNAPLCRRILTLPVPELSALVVWHCVQALA